MLLLEQFENLTLHPKNAARLKELVLQLAVQGKLTENWRRQNPDVEPAAELLKRIEAEKAQLVKEKKIKKEKPLEPISEDEAPYTLPEGWMWCRLQDCLDVRDGTHDTPKYHPEGIPLVTSKNISSGKLSLENVKYISQEDHIEISKRSKVDKGDILFAMIGSIGNPVIVDVEPNFSIKNVALFKYFIENSPAPYYLLLYLNHAQVEMKNSATGAVQSFVSLSGLRQYPFPLPPLAEQEAIVARVEELMQKIEELEKQTAERIQLKQHLGAAALQQLTAATDEELEQNWFFLKQHFHTMFDDAANVKKLRETILQLAVQGKLTANWRTQNPTTEPASDLLKRIQAEKAQLVKEKKIKKEKPLEPIAEDEVPYALPEGWVWCRMADIASKLGAGSTPKGGKEVYVEEGIPFLRSQNVYDDGLRLNGVAQITEAVHQKMSGTHVQPKDILLNITGGSIGRCALVADDFDTANVSQHVAIIRLVDSGIRKYIHYLMTSEMIQRLIMDVQVGVSREGLSMTKLREFLIPLPPLSEQKAIVAKVDQLMQLCDQLEQQIQQSKQEAEALMQAVVQEALQVQEEVEL
ncbi:restriction endonuclease subunit S [Pontibacter sp. HSC-14F20]|uniref:restriction endonuclease subunit S n=1 Tax=Pontibacter sp. HSC-14F20 TaxID=2864136 RepID=UPI001C734D25|nr:restriction endonuclease subunit S [Pontibacter sp. HSC-14F20]MBX0335180.1 restriction endonuclease subunit S [Pontibacter sp. HSC-14F20]